MADRATAIQFFNSAVQSVHDANNPQRHTHAFQLFASACYADPTWFEAFFQAGNNNSDLNFPEASVACYRRAMQCQMTDEDRGKVLTNIGWKLHQLGRTDEALPYCRQAIEVAPELPFAWVNLSCLYLVLMDTASALTAANEALLRAPDDPTVRAAHAFALLFDRRLASGLKAFECRYEYELKNLTQAPYPRWQGEEGATVYLISDQGLGDTLSYARFLRAACKRCKYVHAFIHGELYRAFLNSFVDVPNLNLSATPTPYPPADYWTTFVSLPFALGLTDDEIRSAPPVDLPVYGVPVNWRVPDRKLHIGIAWAGSAANKIDVHRNLPVKLFAELYRVPGIQLYSLQVGPKANEMHEAGLTPVVRDLVPFIRDITDTVSLLQHLDMVICCESAMGHICSTIGKECWMPYSRMGMDYRMGVDGSDQIWSRHRVFKQGPDIDWRPVFDKMCVALEEKIKAIMQDGAKAHERAA